MSEEVASADSLLIENAELRRALDALRAELEVARHVVAAARREQKIAKHIWTQPGEATSVVSAFEIALDQALRTYDEAMKAKD